ncbi:MAG: hypothetical protein CMM25_06655 [Rhodospirillaceae bacterium]|nr:hypothetical protein [Rhodospirillaceae bacterium]|tara:strand:- start:952 stop:1257 length:306 start_codon:yes stop_codon:yes gene_type:complete
MKKTQSCHNNKVITEGTAPSPNLLDIHLGQRLKTQRQAQKLSQKELGVRIGVTFQQLQKYESGKNRISASRLYAISQILNCSISYFFMDFPAKMVKKKKYR